MARYLVYNMTSYTVYSRCSQYGGAWFIHWPVRPGPASARWWTRFWYILALESDIRWQQF